MKYIRRFLFFITSRLVIITVCAALLLCVFYKAYNIGNAFTIVTEGLEKRVEVCLTRQDYTELKKYFTDRFLEKDNVLAASSAADWPWLPYNIGNYDYEISPSDLINWLWDKGFTWIFEGGFTWPWDTEMRFTVVEKVSNISGSVRSGYANLVDSKIPEWNESNSVRYTVILQRQSDGGWKISGIHQDTNYRDAG